MNRHARFVSVAVAGLAAGAAWSAPSGATSTPTSSAAVVTHLAPPGGSQARCLAPALARLKAGYPLHKETQSLASMEATLKAQAHICQGVTGIVRQLPSTTTKAGVTSSTTSSCINCFRVYSYEVCDGWFGNGCFVNGVSTNWSESFVIRFEYRDKHWVESSVGENRTRFPGTWMSTSDVHTPLWGVLPYWVGSVWDFARAYHNPDYVLTRDEFQVTFGLSWFHESWNCRSWMNAYPRGFVQPGFVGSPS